MSDSQVFTYQTRLALTPAQGEALSAYARLYGQVERKLFARLATGETAGKLKSGFLREFGITARQYNAIAISLAGKIASIRERRSGLLEEAATRIARAEKVVTKLEKPPKDEAPAARRKRLAQLHQKRRRLQILRTRHAAMATDHQAGTVRLAFGSRKLFNAQFDLAANGYADHATWKRDWEAARSGQFLVIGSKDEVAGCQGCVATLREDGLLDLRLRLPDALDAGKHLDLTGLRFAYGAEQLRAALASSRVVVKTDEAGKVRRCREGVALSWRFVRDAKGWRVLVSVQVQAPARTTQAALGAVGVDLNADHLAVVEADRFGNFLRAWRLDTPLRGKTTRQRQAILGDAAARAVRIAKEAGKPLALEKLDFAKRKSELEGVDPRRARMLSALAYRQTGQMLRSAAFRAGVEVREVNPAYTSVIGAINHAQPLGLSIHLGAALSLARRSLGLRERATRRQALVPAARGGHVTLTVPARNPSRHVWSTWARARASLRAALAEHYRCGRHKRPPPPLSASERASCASRSSPVRPRSASRPQHCPGDAATKTAP